MDPTRFDTFTRALRRKPSRRAALRSTIGGITGVAAGWLRAVPVHGAKKKHKKKKRAPCPVCPVCPSLPSLPFCAGKNQCAGAGDRLCHQPGASQVCACQIRADTAAPFCAGVTELAAACGDCDPDQVCVVLGGSCPGDFGCAEPCPNPL